MITLHEGSILDVKADAIVNPANSFLNHAGGLARVIDRAACGRSDREYPFEEWAARQEAAEVYVNDQEDAPLIPTGGVHVGPPGSLPYKAIIHAVGPIWGGGSYKESTLLELAMENVCEACIDHGFKSVAVPAISCGVFGFPVARAAGILVQVASWYSSFDDITFAVMGDEHVAAFKSVLDA